MLHAHSSVYRPVASRGAPPGSKSWDGAVLDLLTTERCVPTQAWPANGAVDWPFVVVVGELLQQLGGGCTISKLRSVLKLRLDTAESIKSVPLKAFLLAYASHFAITKNRVSLIRAV